MSSREPVEQGPGRVHLRDAARAVVVCWVMTTRVLTAVVTAVVTATVRTVAKGESGPAGCEIEPCGCLADASPTGPSGRDDGWWRSQITDAVAGGMVDAFIALGPTFVKLGQLIASAPGVFPTPLATACQRCLDAVPPFPAEQARRTIEDDLGRTTQDLFQSFGDMPLASASIAQVHPCMLVDGRHAVVKVQRPGIAERMMADLRIAGLLARAAELIEAGRRLNPTGMVADMYHVTMGELDFLLEARHQQAFRANISAFDDNAWVTAPEVYMELCGPRVICMERLFGVPVDEFDVLRARGLDGELLMRRGLKVGLEAVCVHGPFQADTHAGNIWVLDDGRTAFLDFGITGELPEAWRAMVRDLFKTFMIDSNWARVVRHYKDLGVLQEDLGTDEDLGRLLQAATEPVLDSKARSIDLAELFSTQLDLARQMGATAPRELMLVAKQLFYFERYMKELAPGYALARDLYLIKNIWPEEAAIRAEELGVIFPD
ncbi:MAG: ABC1 kinase family protein [Acidimicrobiales bacterium]